MCCSEERPTLIGRRGFATGRNKRTIGVVRSVGSECAGAGAPDSDRASFVCEGKKDARSESCAPMASPALKMFSNFPTSNGRRNIVSAAVPALREAQRSIAIWDSRCSRASLALARIDLLLPDWPPRTAAPY